jgi:hypothetical protein
MYAVAAAESAEVEVKFSGKQVIAVQEPVSSAGCSELPKLSLSAVLLV